MIYQETVRLASDDPGARGSGINVYCATPTRLTLQWSFEGFVTAVTINDAEAVELIETLRGARKAMKQESNEIEVAE